MRLQMQFEPQFEARQRLAPWSCHFATGKADGWTSAISDSTGKPFKVMCKRLRLTHNLEAQVPLQELITKNVEACRRLNHPNVVGFVGTHFEKAVLAVIVPYYENGSVFSFVRANASVDGTKIFSMISDAIAGVAALHANGIVHGNLHGDNFMVNDYGDVVLIDIGTDAALQSVKKIAHVPERYRWAATELLVVPDDSIPQRTLEADIWSLACTITEILTLKHPLPELRTDVQVLQAHRKGLLIAVSHAKIPQGLWDLLRDCWQRVPSDRPAARIISQRFKTMSDLFNG